MKSESTIKSEAVKAEDHMMKAEAIKSEHGVKAEAIKGEHIKTEGAKLP